MSEITLPLPIKIHRHTPVRRKMSNYVIDLRYFGDEDPHSMDNWEEAFIGKLDTINTNLTRAAKGTYKVNYEAEGFSREALEELGDMLEGAGLKFDDNLGTEPKTPSWWERLRGRK